MIKLPASYKFTTTDLKKIIGSMKGFDDGMPCAVNIWLGTRESPKALIPPEIQLQKDSKNNDTYLNTDFTT